MKQDFILKIYKRPLLRAFFVCTMVSLVSCSVLKKNKKIVILPNNQIPHMLRKDYRDQMASLASILIDNRRVKLIKVNNKIKSYLTEIFNRVISNNELLLKRDKEYKPKFFIINQTMPFIFSLPKNQFFLSRGLIKKYFKNESMLIGALVFEIIKSRREIYYKSQLIPTGVMNIQRLISLVRIGLEDKMKIYKWSYFVLKRAEYDASALLNWIQIQNKNTLDFSWMIGDARVVTREEYEFKNFLASRDDKDSDMTRINSTREFYYFKDRI